MCTVCGGTCGFGTPRRHGRTTIDVNYAGRKLRIVDAGGPAPLYVSRTLTSGSASALALWAKGAGLRQVVDPAEMHVTVAYSKTPVDWFRFVSWNSARDIVIPAGGPRRIEEFKDGVAVLRIASPDLTERWTEFRDGGCSWGWPDYAPHVTIAADASDVDLSRLKAFAALLVFGPEEFAPITQ